MPGPGSILPRVDLSVYHSLNDYGARHDLVGDLAKFFANTAVFVVIAALVVVWLLRGRWASTPDRRAIAAGGFSAILALIAVQVIDHLYDRARPFVHHAHHLLVHHAADASFPSDHVSAMFGIAVALLLRRRLIGLPVLVVGFLIAVARVMVGVHYPSDVVGGMVLGTLVALVLWLPPLRALIDRISDAVANVYERVTGAVLRRPVSPHA